MSPKQEADLERHLAAMSAEITALRQELADLRAAVEHKIPPGWVVTNLASERVPSRSVCRDCVTGAWSMWGGAGAELDRDADLARLVGRHP